MANKIDISGDGGVLKEILVQGEGDETPLKVIQFKKYVRSSLPTTCCISRDSP